MIVSSASSRPRPRPDPEPRLSGSGSGSTGSLLHPRARRDRSATVTTDRFGGSPAASSMPCEVMPRSGRGARFATTTIRLPTSAAGSGYAWRDARHDGARRRIARVHGELQELVRALGTRSAVRTSATRSSTLREVVVADDAGRRAAGRAWRSPWSPSRRGSSPATPSRRLRGRGRRDDELLHLLRDRAGRSAAASPRAATGGPANGSRSASQVPGRAWPNASARPSAKRGMTGQRIVAIARSALAHGEEQRPARGRRPGPPRASPPAAACCSGPPPGSRDAPPRGTRAPGTRRAPCAARRGSPRRAPASGVSRERRARALDQRRDARGEVGDVVGQVGVDAVPELVEREVEVGCTPGPRLAA